MLAEALAALQLPPPRTESLVDVYDFLDARALRYEHVFLIGCNAGLLPASPSAPVLLPEAQRARWASQGLILETRQQLADREMLLMYLAASRAETGLTVSYQVGSAGAASASSYVQALADTQGGFDSHTVQSNTTRIPAGRFLPETEELASRREASIAAVAGLFRSGLDPRGRALAWLGTGQAAQIDQVARGLWMRHCRWQPGPCDRFDGRITEPDLLEALADRFPGRTVFSASQLNRYAGCPWQFFAQYVLRLQALPQAERLLEPVSRGLFCHEVLYRLMTLLAEQNDGPVALDLIDADVLAEALDRAVRAASEAVERKGCAYPVLWRIQRDQLAEALARYIEQEAACRRLEPTHLHFELAFGFGPSDGTDPCDPASKPDPVAIETQAGTIQLRGRIDRVDRVRFDGVDALAAVDYKTGSLPGTDDVREGLDLQLPLYALALQALTDREVFGGSMDQVLSGDRRWFAPFRSPRKMQPDWPDLHRRLDQARQRVGQFVEGMAAGRFDLMAASQCAGFCPYRQICHHSPARWEIKTLGREDRDG
jgi:ATP-dependent helicase/DNAse subunit B